MLLIWQEYNKPLFLWPILRPSGRYRLGFCLPKSYMPINGFHSLHQNWIKVTRDWSGEIQTCFDKTDHKLEFWHQVEASAVASTETQYFPQMHRWKFTQCWALDEERHSEAPLWLMRERCIYASHTTAILVTSDGKEERKPCRKYNCKIFFACSNLCAGYKTIVHLL